MSGIFGIICIFLIPWGLYTIVNACIEESVRRHDAAARQRDRENENKAKAKVQEPYDPDVGAGLGGRKVWAGYPIMEVIKQRRAIAWSEQEDSLREKSKPDS